MTLIDEIEAALRNGANSMHVENQWPRIRAALLAAQEMDKGLSAFIDAYQGGKGFVESESQRKFREAMDGKT